MIKGRCTSSVTPFNSDEWPQCFSDNLRPGDLVRSEKMELRAVEAIEHRMENYTHEKAEPYIIVRLTGAHVEGEMPKEPKGG